MSLAPRKYSLWATVAEVDQVADRVDLDASGNLWLTQGDQVVGLAIAGSFKAVTSEPLEDAQRPQEGDDAPAADPGPVLPVDTHPTQQLPVLVG